VVSGDVRVGEVVISQSMSICDLRVVLDSAGLMDDRIKSVCVRGLLTHYDVLAKSCIVR
jgi:hypothetical protein